MGEQLEQSFGLGTRAIDLPQGRAVDEFLRDIDRPAGHHQQVEDAAVVRVVELGVAAYSVLIVVRRQTSVFVISPDVDLFQR